MHLRAASLAIVVCGLMIGTLAAQYARQQAAAGQEPAPRVNAQSPDHHNHAAPAQQPSDERRKFSLWQALSGNSSQRQHGNQQHGNQQHGSAQQNRASGGLGSWLPFQNAGRQRPDVYSGNRAYVQPNDAASNDSRNPVSQFGPPVGGYGRRPPQQQQSQPQQTAAPAQQHNANQYFERPPTTGIVAEGSPQQPSNSAPVHEAAPGNHAHSHNVPPANGHVQHQTQPQRSRGVMAPLLDLFGNRHAPPPETDPVPRRANSAFAGNAPRNNSNQHGVQHGHGDQDSGKLQIFPEMITNGRPGPMPMMPAEAARQREPEMAALPESASSQPQFGGLAETPAPRPAPQQHDHQPPHQHQEPVASQPVPHTVIPPHSVAPAPANSGSTLPPMASAEIHSNRMGPTQAELGIAAQTPPPAASQSITDADSNQPPADSILSNQPLVRVKEPRPSNGAVESLAKKLNGDPAAPTQLKSYDDWLNHGKLLATDEKFAEAVQAYSRALELDPYGLEAYGNRGLAYRQLQQYREAVYDFNIVLRLSPEMAKGYYDRAETYRMAGKLDKAARDYEEAIKLDPEFALAYAQYGAMLMRNAEFDDAAEILDKAIQLDSADELSRYDRGLARAFNGNFNEALSDLEQVSGPAADQSQWESLLTRMRRPGEMITTTDMPAAPIAAMAADASSIAAAEPSQVDDLMNDPFFSGKPAPKASNARLETAVAANKSPGLFAVKPTQPAPADKPSAAPTNAEPQPTAVAQAPTVQLTPPQNTASQPQPTAIADASQHQQDAEPDTTSSANKPLRIVLGGGSTKLADEPQTVVRVTEPAPQKLAMGLQPRPQEQEPPKIAATQKPSTPVAENKSAGEPSLVLHDADALWAATSKSRAASRAARRGDGSLLNIITRDESTLNPTETHDPFAVMKSPVSASGGSKTVRQAPNAGTSDDKKLVINADKKSDTPADAVQSPRPVIVDQNLPDPKALATMAEVDKAIETYNDAILRRPRYAPYYVARAQLWLKQERRTAALTDLRQAVRLDESLAEARAQRDRLEKEIQADLNRQQEQLRTAGRDTAWGRIPRR